MAVDMDLIKKLRESSGAGFMDCKNALEEAGGDFDKAFTILREKGIAKAGKRAGRATGQGVVEAYLHSTSPDYPPQVGVLIEVDCETDFVAKGVEFRKLAKDGIKTIDGWAGLMEDVCAPADDVELFNKRIRDPAGGVIH